MQWNTLFQDGQCKFYVPVFTSMYSIDWTLLLSAKTIMHRLCRHACDALIRWIRFLKFHKSKSKSNEQASRLSLPEKAWIHIINLNSMHIFYNFISYLRMWTKLFTELISQTFLHWKTDKYILSIYCQDYALSRLREYLVKKKEFISLYRAHKPLDPK